MVSQRNAEFMVKGKMMDADETIAALTDRVFGSIAAVSESYGASGKDIGEFKARLAQLFVEDYFVPSTPIITNAGKDKPLSACSVPPTREGMTRTELEALVNEYHRQGMGTGFNFDSAADPAGEAIFLNNVAVGEFSRGEMERPVGNMGILSVDHPKILEFASLKAGATRHQDWKFNLSVNLTDEFMEALLGNAKYALKDGQVMNASDLMSRIVEYAHSCGDPGLVFLDRFEKTNVTPHLGKYVSLAPCGEIPMASGETCLFSYINLQKFAFGGAIDYSGLRQTVYDVVRMLDNTIDISKGAIANKQSAGLMEKKRKIAVGVCGFADLLFTLGIPYDSPEAVHIAEDVMSFVNYQSKAASVELAKERGAFPALADPETRKELIAERYLGLETRSVKAVQWEKLAEDIRQYGIRNVSTIALPPTGRSSMVINASPSIEPAFRLSLDQKLMESIKVNAFMQNYYEDLGPAFKAIATTGSLQQSNLPQGIKDIYRTCLELSPEAHLNIVAAFQRYTDESIAKTINLPNDCTPRDIMGVYVMAYQMGLKGITAYRDGCKTQQPMKLKEQSAVVL